MDELNIDDLCVICLMESQSYYCIYDRHISDNTPIYEIINDVCQLDITMGDECAQFICNECCTKLLEFSSFKRDAQKARATCQNIKENTQISSLFEDNQVYMDVNNGCNDALTPVHDGRDSVLDSVKQEEDFIESSVYMENTSDGHWTEPENEVYDSSHCHSPEDDSKTSNGYRQPLRMRKVKETVHEKPSLKSDIQRDKSSIVTNTKVHSGKTWFECQICDKGFSNMASLNIHSSIHYRLKPFECQECGRKFSLEPNLILHLRTHTGEKPYECQYCKRNFSCLWVLKQHLRIHTGERPYKCQICGKGFSQSGILTRHKRIHSGERPFKCPYCEKSFCRKTSLVSHSRIHARVNAITVERSLLPKQILSNTLGNIPAKDPLNANIVETCLLQE